MLRLSLSLDSVTLQTPVKVEIALPQSAFMRGDRLKTLWCLHPAFSDGMQLLERMMLDDVAENLDMAVICPSLHNSYFITSDLAPIGDFLDSELYPCMPNLLPLSLDPQDHECLGISMGAYGALNWALRKPGNFSRIYCVGGYYDRSLDEDPRLKLQQRSYLISKLTEPHFIKATCDHHGNIRDDADLKKSLERLKDPSVLPKIEFIVGDHDYLSYLQTRSMYRLFHDAGAAVSLSKISDGMHDIPCWREALALIVKKHTQKSTRRSRKKL